jgi:hypothetical protein
MRGANGFGQVVEEYKTGVKYSYYRILILDTVQPIVNSNNHMKSYGIKWNMLEPTTSFYVMLV